jgi:hypothetical protein
MKVVTQHDTEYVAVKLSTVVLAIAFVAPSTLALAGPMNLADPILVPSQSSTWHDHHAGRHSSPPHGE